MFGATPRCHRAPHQAFNVYRMFLRMYGPDLASAELAGFISRTEAHYNALLAALPAELAGRYKARCAEAVRDGGGGGGDGAHPDGKWTIPAPIADEDQFRASCT